MKHFLQRLLLSFSEIEFFVVGYGILLTTFYYLNDITYSVLIRYKIMEAISETSGMVVVYSFWIGVLLVFTVYSIYHALSTRKKNIIEKKLMFYCMVPIHIAVILYLGLHNLDTLLGKIVFIQSILGLWVLYVAMPRSSSDETHFFAYTIRDEETKRTTVFTALCISIVIFVSMVHVFSVEWFLVFSVLYLYAPILVGLLRDYLTTHAHSHPLLLSNSYFSFLLVLPLLGVYVLSFFA